MIQSRKPWARLDLFVFLLNYIFSKFINDFLVINSLLLNIKYKLYVTILSTSIPFVFASIFKGSQSQQFFPNLYSCLQDIKSTGYQTLVRPHIEYSSTVWTPTHSCYPCSAIDAWGGSSDITAVHLPTRRLSRDH